MARQLFMMAVCLKLNMLAYELALNDEVSRLRDNLPMPMSEMNGTRCIMRRNEKEASLVCMKSMTLTLLKFILNINLVFLLT